MLVAYGLFLLVGPRQETRCGAYIVEKAVGLEQVMEGLRPTWVKRQ